MNDPTNQPDNQSGNQSENQPDLSLTVWAKTLTPQQRADAKEPTPRTVEAWLRVIAVERDAGRIVLSPPDIKGQFRSPAITLSEIVKELINSGGFTLFSYGFIDKKLIPGAEGIGDKPAWAAAVGGTELKEKEWKHKQGSRKRRKKAAKLRRYRRKKWYFDIELLLEASGACVGGWISSMTGEYEINVTLIFWSQEAAERFGLRHAQYAIFELSAGIEIVIGGDGSTEWIRGGQSR